MLLSRVKKLCQKERHLQSRHCLLLYRISSFSHKLNLRIVNGQPTAAEQHKKVQKVLSYDT